MTTESNVTQGTNNPSNIQVTLPAGGEFKNPTNESKESTVDTSKVQQTNEPKLVDPTSQQVNQQTEPTNQPNLTQDSIVRIDGVDYKLNQTGDAIGADGNVFMSKSKIDEFANQPADVSIVDEVEKINNIVLKNDKGEKIVYDSTPIGIAAREKDILTYGQQIGKQSGVSEFLQSNPDINEIVEYKQRYGTLEGYGVRTDYEALKLDTKNKDLMKQVIIEAELLSGKTKESAKKYADYLEANNELEDASKTSHDLLKTKQINERTEQQQRITENNNSYYGVIVKEDESIEDLNIEGSLYDVIFKKGEANGIRLPKEGIDIKTGDGKILKLTPSKLFEFAAYSADNTGRSQLDIAIDNFKATPKNKLALGLYILKGGDLSDLVQKQVSQNKILEIRTQKQVNSSSTNKGRNIVTNGKEQLITPL